MPSQDGESFRVFIRTRPDPDILPELGQGQCVTIDHHGNTVTVLSKPDPKVFTFDHVVEPHVTQEAVFTTVGKPMIDSCMAGYNATIFAYGQTGSGKTFTMLGPPENSDSFKHEIRGVIPRGLEQLFSLINRETQLHGSSKDFLCKCSFLEIYNEKVYDLLDPVSAGLTLRENMKQGVFVDGIIEQTVASAADAYQVLNAGWINRKVAYTSMNRESSRSHAVFTVIVESKENEGGIQRVRSSRLNLVDLAGSERQKDTKTSGVRLKEASSINQSLSTLGNVIMALGHVTRGQSRYIPYRDSKLTFLLKDSLGGNAKTQLIACIHPHYKCFGETLSTLQFAQRAKLIKNKATINVNTEGNISALEAEIRQLRSALSNLNPALANFNPALAPSAPVFSTETSDSAPDKGDNWQQMFVQAMMLREASECQRQKLQGDLQNLKDLIKKKDQSLLNSNMIIKFRVADIESLKTSIKNETPIGNDDVNKRMANLESEVNMWKALGEQHRECGQLGSDLTRLRSEIKLLKSTPDILQASRENKELSGRLQETYASIMEDGVLIDTTANCSACRKHTDDVANLSQEIVELKQKHQTEREASNKDLVSLQTELSNQKKMVAEYEQMLNTRQRKNDIERRTMNDMHLHTIKTITTPTQGRYHLRSRHIPTTPLHLTPDLLFESPDLVSGSPLTGACGGVFDEVPPKEITEGLNDEIKSLQDANSHLQKSLEELEQQEVTQNHKVVSLTSQTESLQQSLENHRKTWMEREGELTVQIGTLTKANSDHAIVAEELEDLRVMMKSGERRVTEMAATLEAANTRNMKKELEMTDLHKRNDSLSEELDSLQEQLETAQTTLTFTEEQVQTMEVKLGEELAARQLLQSHLQDAEDKYKQETEKYEQLLASQGQNQEAQFQQLRNQVTSAQQERDKLSEMEAQFQQLRNQVTSTQQDRHKLSEMVEFQSQQMVRMNTDLITANSTVDTQEKLLIENKEVITSLTTKIHDLKTQLQATTSDNTTLSDTVELLTEKIASSQKSCKQQMVQISALEEQRQELMGQMERERTSNEFNASIRQDELDYSLECIDKLNTETQSLNAIVKLKQDDLAQSIRENERLTSELSDKCEEIIQLKTRTQDTAIIDLTTPTTPLNTNNTELLNLIEERDKTIEAQKGSLAELQQLLVGSEETWASKNAELHILQDKLKEEVTERETQECRTAKLLDVVAEIENRYEFTNKELQSMSKELCDVRAAKDKFEEKCTRLEINEAVVRVREEAVASLQEQIARLHQLAERDLDEKTELQSQLEKLQESHKNLESNQERLQNDNARLVGHSNHKQKIQFHLALKDELNVSKKKVESLQHELAKFKGRGAREPVLTENIDPNIAHQFESSV